jgi:hypothetical protein
MEVELFRRVVIRPVLQETDLWSESAENLLLGTALHESGGLQHIRQIGGGPALGFYQMEPATLDDLYDNWLKFRMVRLNQLEQFRPMHMARENALLYMPAYATAAARLQYFRVPKPLPLAGDIEGLAHYWKDHWNTHEGAGTIKQFMDAWVRHGG